MKINRIAELVKPKWERKQESMPKEETPIMPQSPFDFTWLSLGLIPIQGGNVVVNPGSITDLASDGAGGFILRLHGGREYYLSPEQMIELEATIKQRQDDQKILQREAMKNQMLMQNDIVQELQREQGLISKPGLRRTS